jgi:hypothetical protein
MAVLDLVTLAEFKDFLPKSGSARDAAMRVAITRASRELEGACGRRFIYRAPPEVDGAANILASRTLVDETIASGSLAAQPNSAGRTLIITVTDADASVTAGTVTVTGTVAGVAGTTEAFNLAGGLIQHGVKFFTAISQIVVAVTGEGAGDTIKVGSSLGYVEYYTIPCGLNSDRSILRTIERPLQQVLAVYEDPYRVYGSDTLLVAGTDYVVSKDAGRIERLSSGVGYAWQIGRRAIKAVNSAGYFGTTNVPADLKGHALHLAAQFYLEADKGQIEVASGSNALGSWTRMGPAGLTRKTHDALWSTGHIRIEDVTAERDFDLEAA